MARLRPANDAGPVRALVPTFQVSLARFKIPRLRHATKVMHQRRRHRPRRILAWLLATRADRDLVLQDHQPLRRRKKPPGRGLPF